MTIYQGISFPFRKGTTSFPAQAIDADLIRDSLIQIVLTRFGERVMRPSFGSNIYSLVFENNDAVLAELLNNEIGRVIGQFEPRVILRGISVTQADTTVVATIDYVIRTTGQIDSLSVEVPSGGF